MNKPILKVEKIWNWILKSFLFGVSDLFEARIVRYIQRLERVVSQYLIEKRYQVVGIKAILRNIQRSEILQTRDRVR